jgi:predicted small secreted protein
MRRLSILLPAVLLLTAGCSTANKAGNLVKSAGETVAEGVGDVAGAGVSLVNVDLSNVLNDLALDLNIDKSNIPINAQIPISLAANICGVSINILSVSNGGSPNCTAASTSPELTQAVQQQLAAGGSVGGGNQTTAPTNTSPAPATTTETTTTTATPATTDQPQQ